MLRVTKGALIEYALSIPPLVLVFDFNPKTLSRNRSIQINTGSTPSTRGGHDFALPTETARVVQSVAVQPESFTIEILLDATDRMNQGEPIATKFGIEPELDTLRSMVEPKSQGPGGLQMLASLGFGEPKAFQRNESPSVLLFVWGTHVLPVFMTAINVNQEAHFASLVPYRATVSITMQVIESNNPFYKIEKVRQVIGAALNTGRIGLDFIGGLL